MFSLISAGLSAAPEIGVNGAVDLGRGAIAGGLVIAAAYLAGYAVFRRGSAAVCGLIMVLAAAALEFSWLGLIQPPPQFMVLLQGLFGAAAIIFLSATIRTARNNAILGGVMFAAALSLVGIGVINLLGRGDASGLMRLALGGVGGFAVLLTLSQSLRDSSARLIVPGAVAAVAAAALAGSGGGFSLLPHALFTFGILTASLVALTDVSLPRVRQLGLHAGEAHAASLSAEPASPSETPEERALRVSENQLAQVLDYTGVTVWDWSPDAVHQTDGFPTLMGADSRGSFTPDTMRAFIHKDDVDRFEKQVLAASLGDGSFDVTLKLHDGRAIRMRGARAVDSSGELERLVGFVESVTHTLKTVRPAAAPVAAIMTPPAAEKETSPPTDPLSAAFGDALEKGDIQAVFQPIVELETNRIAGYEALARWRGEKEGAERASAEELVRAAQAAGKGRALATLILGAAADHLLEQMRQLDRRDLFVAVNLSVAQISEKGFSSEVRALIDEKQLPPRALVLELTETEALTDIVDAEKIFKEMKAAGAALAFDDFGAGFSSLSNLSRFDFDYLKIDKSFISGAAVGDAKIARSLAALGRDMGLTVIAEGIESRELADAAREMGCALGQGYALGAPAANDLHAPEEEAKIAKKSFFGGGMR